MMKRAFVVIFVVVALLACVGAQMAGSKSDNISSAQARSIDLIDVQTGSNSVSIEVGDSFSVDAILDGVTNFLNKYEVTLVFNNASIKCLWAEVPRYDPRYVFSGENFTMGFVSVMNWQGVAVAGSSLLPHMYSVQENVTSLVRYVNASGEKLLCRFGFAAISSGVSKIELRTAVNESTPFRTFLMDVNNGTLDFTPGGFEVNVSPRTEIQAEAHIMPKVLNIRSRGKYVTALIRFQGSTYGMKVNFSSVLLNSTIVAERRPVWADAFEGILMVKFDRQVLADLIVSSEDGNIHQKIAKVTLAVTGSFENGTGFEASDVIWVIWSGSFWNFGG